MLYQNIKWLYKTLNYDKSLPNSLHKFATSNLNKISRYPGPISENILTHTVEDILKSLDAMKPTTDVLSTAKTIYFSPASKYPRFKFSATTTIKKTITVSKADVIVNNREVTKKSFKHRSNAIVLTSAATDSVFGITLGTIIEISYLYSKLQLMVRNITDEKDLAEKFIAMAISEKLIPEDCVIAYFGDILEGNNKICKFIGDLLNNLTPVIEDIDLDKHVNNKLQKISKSDLEQIDKWFKSSDAKVVELGITMLSSFNANDSSCAIGILLITNIENINRCRCNGAAFKQLLKTLDLENIPTYNSNRLINNLYKQSTNEEDRAQGREVVISNMKSELTSWFKDQSKWYENMDLKIDFNIT